jgi:hypothetical protein
MLMLLEKLTTTQMERLDVMYRVFLPKETNSLISSNKTANARQRQFSEPDAHRLARKT